MSTKTQAILEEIRALPQAEFRALCDQVNRLADQMESSTSRPAQVSDAEFAVALDELTASTAGGNALQRLLDERRRDRERDEAELEARKRNRARG
jgi:hypothetical protein